MKCGLVYQGTFHLDQTNPLVIWHLFVDLPRTPKEAGIPGYHKIAVFAIIYSKAFCIFPSVNCSQNSWMQHIHFRPFDAFGIQLSTMHSFSSEEIYMSYSFFHPRNNLWNLTKYILDNVLTLLNSFPLSNLTEMSWMQQTCFGWLWGP